MMLNAIDLDLSCKECGNPQSHLDPEIWRSCPITGIVGGIHFSTKIGPQTGPQMGELGLLNTSQIAIVGPVLLGN